MSNNKLPAHTHYPAIKNEPRLEILSGSEEGVIYRLHGNEISIGRGKDNDIPIDDRLASRYHAIISLDKGNYLLKNLESRNGVEVNGKSTELCELEHGDKIKIGETTFQITFPEQEQEVIYDRKSGLIDDLGPIKPRRRILLPLIIFSVLATVIYWAVSPSSTTETKNKQQTREPFSLPPPTLPDRPIRDDINDRVQQENLAAADSLYQKGFRELLAQNHLRAISFFQAALALYPNHKAAIQKMQRAENEITALAEESFNLGRRYFESHYWQRAIYNFERTKLLLGEKRDSHYYVESERLETEARGRLYPPTIMQEEGTE